MISVKETINKTITVKDAYMDNGVLVDEDASAIDLNDLLQRTYGDGVQFTIKVSAKADRDLNE